MYDTKSDVTEQDDLPPLKDRKDSGSKGPGRENNICATLIIFFSTVITGGKQPATNVVFSCLHTRTHVFVCVCMLDAMGDTVMWCYVVQSRLQGPSLNQFK